MILRLYAGASGAATPWLRRMLDRRAKRGKEIPARLPEREGIASYARPAGRLVWIHAASVGEMMSALPIMALLVAHGPVLLTTGTVTSASLALERVPAGVIHQFAPLDTPLWTARFLDYWRPDIAVFMESEIWPNLLLACDDRQVPRFLLNARLSAASARNWRRVPGTARRLLHGFTAIHAQSEADAARFQALGANKVLAWGNLKFSPPPLPYAVEDLASLQRVITGPVWLAASTHSGEEEIIFAAHKVLAETIPDLITIIVPRHPERGARVASLCAGAPRRALAQPPVLGRVYVADTLGELGLFFRLAPFAFVGNSLVAGGGHNIIEPAKLTKPVICGPHMENFVEAVECMKNARALAQIHGADDLAQQVRAWLLDPVAAKAAGLRGQEAFSQMERLPEQLVDLILEGVR